MMNGKKILVYAMTGALTVSLIQGGLVTAKTKSKTKIKISLNKKKATISVGKKVRLRVKGVSAKKVKWTSSKKAVAQVSNKGVVSGKKAGKTKVTAKVGKKKYTCLVTVKAKTGKNSTSSSKKVNWNTVSSKFDKLSQYVTSNGEETEDGISLVTKETEDDVTTKVSVTYDSDDEALIFEKSEEGTDEGYSVTMTITKEDAETADVECQVTQSGMVYIGTSEIEIAEFTDEEESLGFDFDEGTPTTDDAPDGTDSAASDTQTDADSDENTVTSPSDDVVEELDGLGTDYLNDALTAWDEYLEDQSAGVSLKDLGFVTYEF